MVSKSSLILAAVAVTGAANAGAANAQQDSSDPGLLGAIHGPHPGYYKYQGSKRPLGARVYPAGSGDPFEVCESFFHDLGLNQYNMKGNIYNNYNGVTGQFQCQAFNNDAATVVLVPTTDYNWVTIKGNYASPSPVDASSGTTSGGRKMLQENTTDGDNAATTDDAASSDESQLGSTPIGWGWRYIGTPKASNTFGPFKGQPDPWGTCNPYCSNISGLNQYNMGGTAVMLANNKIECACFDVNASRLVSADSHIYYSFKGSHAR